MVGAGCRNRSKDDDGRSTRPEYVPPLQPHQSDKPNSVEGTPPPEYCPRPANSPSHQRARVKSRFDPNDQGSGYADLGLGFDGTGSSLPHGYTATRSNEPEVTVVPPSEASMNRSLQSRSPRRANQPTDSAPLGYVNKSFTDDGDVSDRPTRGRRRSDGAARGQPRSSNVEPQPSSRGNEFFDENSHPRGPLQDVSDFSPASSSDKPVKKPGFLITDPRCLQHILISFAHVNHTVFLYTCTLH